MGDDVSYSATDNGIRQLTAILHKDVVPPTRKSKAEDLGRNGPQAVVWFAQPPAVRLASGAVVDRAFKLPL
jgi:hypothetical protein